VGAFALVFVVVNVAEVAGKSLVAKPPLELHPALGAPIRLGTFDATFPSGHAARALLIAAALAACLPRIRVLLYLWVAAVGVALVVAGAHAPSDVAGGLLLGFFCLGMLEAWQRTTLGGLAQTRFSRALTPALESSERRRRSPPA
jgi:membrane-associated phospholipid phosphatase